MYNSNYFEQIFSDSSLGSVPNPQRLHPEGNTKKPINLKKVVTGILIDLGVPPHIKGYVYLREAILYSIENPRAITAITKVLYPAIAEKFESSTTQVERAIRHAIEVAWNRNDYASREQFFGSIVSHSNYKPTNSEFIATISDVLKVQIDSYLE